MWLREQLSERTHALSKEQTNRSTNEWKNPQNVVIIEVPLRHLMKKNTKGSYLPTLLLNNDNRSDQSFSNFINLWFIYFYCRSDKKSPCSDPGSARKNGSVHSSGVPPPPPIPMSPIVEKMEGLKAIRNRSNSLRLGRLAFYRHLEKVETMRSFWELKHVEMEGGDQQVKAPSDLCPLPYIPPYLFLPYLPASTLPTPYALQN